MYVFYYLILMNIITFASFALDKLAAVRHRRRIRVRTLFLLTLCGGSAGALLGMYLCRHKTRKRLFTVGVPLILLLHIALLVGILHAFGSW